MAMLHEADAGFAAMSIMQLAILSVSTAFGAVLGAVVYYELRAAREDAEFDRITTVLD